MRCQACNKALTDFESSKRHPKTKEFTDLCTGCYNAVVSSLMYSPTEAVSTLEDEPLTNLINCDSF